MERSFEIVGEAARRLRDEDPRTFARLSENPKMIGTRIVVVHGYDEITYDRLRMSIKGPVPQLLTEVEDLERELGD